MVFIYLFLFNILGAQNLDSVSVLISKKDLGSAKQLIDEYVLLNPNDVKGYLLKAEVYNQLSKDPASKELVGDALQVSFNSIKNAYSIDNKLVNSTLKPSNYKLIFDIYKGYSYEGVAFFNAAITNNNKANFKESYATFKKAEAVSKYIYTNGWGLTETDTLNLYYLALSSIHADNDNVAVLYCKRIADNRLFKNDKYKGYEQIYEWLAYYFKGKNEPEPLLKYTDIGNQVFPESRYFDENYIEWLTDQKDYSELINRYEHLFTRGLATNDDKYAYLVVIFNYLPNTEETLKISLLNKFEKGINDYIIENPASADAKLLYSKHLLNQAAALQRSFGSMPMNEQTYRALNDSVGVYLKKSNVYLKDIADNNTNADPALYNNAIGLLVANYVFLGKTKEAKKYQAKHK